MARYGYDIDHRTWNGSGRVPDPNDVYRPGTGWGSIGGRRQVYDGDLHPGGGGMAQNHSRGWMHPYDRDFVGGHQPAGHRGYSGDFRDPPGRPPLTGMESNRMRGVEGSHFRPGRVVAGDRGTYRGESPRNGGPGMNPGRGDPRR